MPAVGIYFCSYILNNCNNNFIMKILVVFTLVNKEQRMDVKV